MPNVTFKNVDTLTSSRSFKPKKRDTYNDDPVVEFTSDKDLHVHCQHGARGILEEMPRVSGESGNLLLDMCVVDAGKAQAIADFVTDIPKDKVENQSSVRGVGVYFANGDITGHSESRYSSNEYLTFSIT